MTAGAGLQARDRCRADDRAVALPGHVRDRVFDGEERPDQIDAQHFLPVFRSLFGERHQPAADAGIGPDRIELAVFRHRLGDERLHVGFVAGIRHDSFHGAAGIADELCGLLDALGLVHRDQLCAFFGEQQRRRASNAAAGAGDHDRFALDAAHEFLPDRSIRTLAALRNFKQDFKRQSHLRRCVL